MAIEILEKRFYANKYYAKIHDDTDGTITEISSVNELSDMEWENLYNELKQAEIEAEQIELEAEDGTEV